MSVLEALKRPEYKLENIRKDAAAAPAAATIDLTSDDDEEEEVSVSKEKVIANYVRGSNFSWFGPKGPFCVAYDSAYVLSELY